MNTNNIHSKNRVATIWLSGITASGKTTLGKLLYEDLNNYGIVKDFVSPITTKPWGKFIPKLAECEKPNQGEIKSQILYSEPKGLNTKKDLPTIDKNSFKKGVYY